LWSLFTNANRAPGVASSSAIGYRKCLVSASSTAIDASKPDLGALPLGAEPFKVGPSAAK
jgi:hypothetical protein